MNDKFRLTNEKMIYNGHTLYRIQALADIPVERMFVKPKVIKAGTLGGWVESEFNLSILDSSWIADEAKVYGDASVDGGALIAENAEVFDFAEVSGGTHVCGNAKIYGNAVVYGSALIRGNARIFDDAIIVGSCYISDNAMINEKAVILKSEVKEYAHICGHARVADEICVRGQVVACGTATLDYTTLYDEVIEGRVVYTE